MMNKKKPIKTSKHFLRKGNYEDKDFNRIDLMLRTKLDESFS